MDTIVISKDDILLSLNTIFFTPDEVVSLTLWFVTGWRGWLKFNQRTKRMNKESIGKSK